MKKLKTNFTFQLAKFLDPSNVNEVHDTRTSCSSMRVSKYFANGGFAKFGFCASETLFPKIELKFVLSKCVYKSRRVHGPRKPDYFQMRPASQKSCVPLT